MWWIVSLISLLLLAIEGALTTLMIMILLNGFPSLPDAMVNLYLVCAGGSLPALSLLAGWLARKLSQISRVPLWLAGILTIIASLVMFPILLFVLTFVLLAVFGKI